MTRVKKIVEKKPINSSTFNYKEKPSKNTTIEIEIPGRKDNPNLFEGSISSRNRSAEQVKDKNVKKLSKI